MLDKGKKYNFTKSKEIVTDQQVCLYNRHNNTSFYVHL